MTETELIAKLNEIRSLPNAEEVEWVEFKVNNFKPDEIGEYLSALSNSATLEGQPFGYVVWGVQDKTRELVGSQFFPGKEKGKGNEDLEPWLTRSLEPQIDFKFFDFVVEGHRVVLLRIPAATSRPISFHGDRFIRVGSYKHRLAKYPAKEASLFAILLKPKNDWSAEICPGATLEDLDPDAVRFAREQFKNKNQNQRWFGEIDDWDDNTFLNKSKVAIGGRLTRAAILLLGRPEADHLLSPAVAKVSWILKDNRGLDIDYAHYGIPFLLSVGQLFEKVRNVTYRYLRDATLFPTEIDKYDPWVIREALHNCIAHQDYSLGGRINVVEDDEGLTFANLGNFLPESVEWIIERDAPPETYRNPRLAEAMVNFKMMDTIGSGIRRMFRTQRDRFFPLPDFDLSDPNRVKVRVPGKVLDENYTRTLMVKTDLELRDVIALDKVQKRKDLSDAELRSLRAQKLIEGRRPNFFISAKIASITGQKSQYLRQRGLDNAHYKQLVLTFLEKFQSASRHDIDDFLIPKLSESLDEAQKRKKIGNLLQEMAKKDHSIHAEGITSGARWVLTK